MRTFSFNIAVAGKITIPDTVLRSIRDMGAETPAEGGATHLNKIHKEFYEDDDKFLQAALKNALRTIVRAGLVSDLGGLGDGVGYRVAPATVEVSVPERVVTKVKARDQIPVAALDVRSIDEPDVSIPLGGQYVAIVGSEPLA